MNVSAPRQITLWISIILVILGILPLIGLGFGVGYILSWGILVGYLVLLAGVLFDGM